MSITSVLLRQQRNPTNNYTLFMKKMHIIATKVQAANKIIKNIHKMMLNSHFISLQWQSFSALKYVNKFLFLYLLYK